MSISQKNPKIILLTGASSGIGAATARWLADEGHQLVVGARRLERLQSLATEIRASGGKVDIHALDVTQQASVEAFAYAALSRYGRIDVMINNAGIMPLSPMAALHVSEWDQMIDVNIRGVLYGIAAVLPTMTQSGRGHIINVSSIGGLAVVPTASVYCATKYAVRAISDGLRQENDALRVTCVYPGVVESELANSITDETAARAMEEYRKIALKPEAIAAAIAYAVGQPDGVDVNDIVVRPTASMG